MRAIPVEKPKPILIDPAFFAHGDIPPYEGSRNQDLLNHIAVLEGLIGECHAKQDGAAAMQEQAQELFSREIPPRGVD